MNYLHKNKLYKGIQYCSATEEKYGKEAPEAIVHPLQWLCTEMIKHEELYRKDGEKVVTMDFYSKLHETIDELKGWPPNCRVGPNR